MSENFNTDFSSCEGTKGIGRMCLCSNITG